MKYTVDLILPPPRATAVSPLLPVKVIVALSLMGPPGLPGASGTGAPLVHVQLASAGTWTIPHVLGRIPAVSVYDTGGNQIEPDVYVDTTSAVLMFSTPTAGKALLS